MRSLIRYTTTPETADENERLVANVYAELADLDPGGIRYATLRLEDGVTFIHIFTTETDGDNERLTSLPAFVEFQRELAQRVVAPPAAQGWEVVGSYRLLHT